MSETSFVSGAWLACCDRCGHNFLNTQLRLQWNGLRCCSGPGTNGCWEPRNAQESLRGRADRQAPPWVRPDTEGPDVSIETGTPVSAEDL